MATFVDAMSAPDSTKVGVKGSDVYTAEGVGSPLLTFYTTLARHLSPTQINSYVSPMLAKDADHKTIEDLLVLMFQTRDIRGGKGERDLFYHMMNAVLFCRPKWAVLLLSLVPEYGCWLDLWKIWQLCPQSHEAIDILVKRQFALDQEAERPSLLVKWLPRQGSKYDALAKHFADLLFPATPAQGGGRLRAYRKALACLNRAADTTEIKMCDASGAWSQISARKVPGRLFKRCKSAFFNQKQVQHGLAEVRYPDRQDRITCAENFKDHMESVKKGEVKMKGADTTMPHEHVAAIYNRQTSPETLAVIQAQWDAIRERAAEGGGLGAMVPMCDFSGSMDGVPKMVSLALGILISELASPAFRDCILTFDSEPRWFNFASSGCKTLADKVLRCGSLGQGTSTDFQAACDLILKRLIEHKVAPEDAPKDLLVLTDMGFDAACAGHSYSYYTGNNYSHNVKAKPWETHFQMIRANFEKYGYTAPRIICWNLGAEYKDFHAKAHEVGVVQLSGWSPSALKALTTKGVEVQTPYQGLRALLDVERYDPVRQVAEKIRRCELDL